MVPGDSPTPICVRCAFALALGDSSDDPPTEILGETAGEVAFSQQRIGPYLLRKILGEGGMGIVWEAEQQEPIRRRVALKCMRLGMGSAQFLARFESERQALALMSHPNIARAFDAGCTSEGQPYFAMELVDGPWITRYCDAERLDIRHRLELFMDVCRGIQHAHQRGVIHRDIKPSNVLVQIEAGHPVPKIIDFGVAKAMGARLTDRTLMTRIGQAVGTPEYMSPEQAGPAGFDIDTRTDVYSLGTLLYELLTGHLPFELSDGDPDDLRRRIREEEPSRPSARVRETGPRTVESAQFRRTEPVSLARSLKGDLDWIVLKALAKDRTRRYGTPEDLAADIGRYLANEPVVAGPPSAAYRARKFVRRHRFGVTVAGVAVVGVIGFGVAMVVEAGRIARERDRANAEATKAQKVSGFLESLFQSIDPARAKGKEVTVREVADEGRARIQKELESQPEIEVPLLVTLGGVYRDLGAYAQSHDLIEEAVKKSRAVSGANSRQTLVAERNLAWLFFREGKNEEARAVQEPLLPRCRAALGDDDPETLHQMNNLGTIYFNLGRNKEAEAILRAAVERLRRVSGADDPQTLVTMNNLAHTYRNLFRFKEAESLCREAIEGQKRVLGPDHLEAAMSMANLAGILSETQRFAEAEQVHREVYAIRRRALGEEHTFTLQSLDGVASALINQRRYAEGGALERKIADSCSRLFGPDDPQTLGAVEGVAICEDAQGHHEQARVLMSDVYEGFKRRRGPGNRDTLVWEGNLAQVTARLGRLDEADALARDMLEISRRVHGENSLMTSYALYELGAISALRGRKRQALDYLGQADAAGDSLVKADLPNDKDFRSLRGDPEYERRVASVKARGPTPRSDPP